MTVPLSRVAGEVSRLGRRTLLGVLAAAPALACQRVAEVPLRLIDGFPVVAASLAGRPVSFVLDTGAQGMLVTPEAAATLALPAAGLRQVFGTGGSQMARIVGLPGLRLGGAPMPPLQAPVLPLPIALPGEPPVAGLLGALLLSRFDLELDVPNRRIALWAPGECPLPKGMTLPLEVSRYGEAFVPVQVEGQSLLALLDSGSRATILSDQAARRLRVTTYITLEKAAGVDGTRQPIMGARIRLRLDREAETTIPVSVAPLQLDRGDMLLGMDQLAARRLWVLYGRGVAVFGG